MAGYAKVREAMEMVINMVSKCAPNIVLVCHTKDSAIADSDVTVFLEKYFGEKTESLSRAALETAAIIAYRQPVTKAEVEEMREVNSSGTMKYLLDKNLIKVVGRKQVPGKPLLYATTKYLSLF